MDRESIYHRIGLFAILYIILICAYLINYSIIIHNTSYDTIILLNTLFFLPVNTKINYCFYYKSFFVAFKNNTLFILIYFLVCDALIKRNIYLYLQFHYLLDFLVETYRYVSSSKTLASMCTISLATLSIYSDILLTNNSENKKIFINALYKHVWSRITKKNLIFYIMWLYTPFLILFSYACTFIYSLHRNNNFSENFIQNTIEFFLYYLIMFSNIIILIFLLVFFKLYNSYVISGTAKSICNRISITKRHSVADILLVSYIHLKYYCILYNINNFCKKTRLLTNNCSKQANLLHATKPEKLYFTVKLLFKIFAVAKNTLDSNIARIASLSYLYRNEVSCTYTVIRQKRIVGKLNTISWLLISQVVFFKIVLKLINVIKFINEFNYITEKNLPISFTQIFFTLAAILFHTMLFYSTDAFIFNLIH